MLKPSVLTRAFQRAVLANLTIRFSQNELSTTKGDFVVIDDDTDIPTAFVELVDVALDDSP